MNTLMILLEGESGGLPSSLISIGMIVILFVALYFFMIRPQKKQERKDNEMRNALAVGDEVTTIGGIIGKVISIKDETFVLETTKEKTQIRFLKGAIRSVDVKVADIAAAAAAPAETAEPAETQDPAAPAAEEPQEPQKKKGLFKKNK